MKMKTKIPMKKNKKTLEQEINEFLEIWDYKQQCAFLRDILPIVELYNVEENDDWVAKEVSGDKQNVNTVRLVRSVFLISRLCEIHAGKMCMMSVQFKNLWSRLQKWGESNDREH